MTKLCRQNTETESVLRGLICGFSRASNIYSETKRNFSGRLLDVSKCSERRAFCLIRLWLHFFMLSFVNTFAWTSLLTTNTLTPVPVIYYSFRISWLHLSLSVRSRNAPHCCVTTHVTAMSAATSLRYRWNRIVKIVTISPSSYIKYMYSFVCPNLRLGEFLHPPCLLLVFVVLNSIAQNLAWNNFFFISFLLTSFPGCLYYPRANVVPRDFSKV